MHCSPCTCCLWFKVSEGQPWADHLNDSSTLAALQELLTLVLCFCSEQGMFGADTGREHSPLERSGIGTVPCLGRLLKLNLVSLCHTLLGSVQIFLEWFWQ